MRDVRTSRVEWLVRYRDDSAAGHGPELVPIGWIDRDLQRGEHIVAPAVMCIPRFLAVPSAKPELGDATCVRRRRGTARPVFPASEVHHVGWRDSCLPALTNPRVAAVLSKQRDGSHLASTTTRKNWVVLVREAPRALRPGFALRLGTALAVPSLLSSIESGGGQEITLYHVLPPPVTAVAECRSRL
jgi:hypothetical protein